MIHKHTLAQFMDLEQWAPVIRRRKRRLEGALVIKGYVVDPANAVTVELVVAKRRRESRVEIRSS